jgi:hypothetical protein
MNSNLIILLVILIILIILIMFITYKFTKNKLTVDSFSNLYTKDNCCNQDEIAQCETYGKTGVCNYYKNNNSCMCQNSF